MLQYYLKPEKPIFGHVVGNLGILAALNLLLCWAHSCSGYLKTFSKFKEIAPLSQVFYKREGFEAITKGANEAKYATVARIEVVPYWTTTN